MPNQQVRRAVSLPAFGHVDGAACAQEYSGRAGTDLRPAPWPPIWQLIKLKKKNRSSSSSLERPFDACSDSGFH